MVPTEFQLGMHTCPRGPGEVLTKHQARSIDLIDDVHEVAGLISTLTPGIFESNRRPTGARSRQYSRGPDGREVNHPDTHPKG